MRKIASWIVLATLPIAAMGGCGPEVSRSELGRVLPEVPQVPGAEKPYQFPKSDKPAIHDPHALESQNSQPTKKAPADKGDIKPATAADQSHEGHSH
jgi:hypothetical protein